MRLLYHAHSGLRYLVLLAACAALIGLAHALATGRTTRAARLLPIVFTGLLDLQVVLGIGLVIGGMFTDAVASHMVLMVVAVAVAHGSSIAARRAPTDQRELAIRFGGIVVTVAIVAGGIMMLGSGIAGSAPPTSLGVATEVHDSEVQIPRLRAARFARDDSEGASWHYGSSRPSAASRGIRT